MAEEAEEQPPPEPEPMPEEEGEGEEGPPAKVSERRYGPLDQKPTQWHHRCKVKCNQRIHELAQPNRRQFLDLWKSHAYHFPPEKCQKLRRLLQQMYAMTPEEAQRYFEQLREEARERARRRRIRAKIKAYLKMKRLLRQRQQAFKHLWRLVRALLHYALNHKPPAFMSSRLMIISNVMLEQLCDIMNVDTLPDRAKPDRFDEFMIRIADWAAIAAENLYYQTQRTIGNCLDCFDGYKGVGHDPPGPVPLSAGQTMVQEVKPEPEEAEEVEDQAGDATGTATQAG